MRQNLPSLTGLRYLAAAAVFFNHVTPFFAGDSSATATNAHIGYLGVEFFFVLSGFILTWTFRPTLAPRGFYRRRFARIYPLYILALLAAIALEAFGPITPHKIIGWVLSVFLLQAWTTSKATDYAGNDPGWSVSGEAFFYALFPFLIRRLPKVSSAGFTSLLVGVVALGVVLGLLPFYSPWFAYRNPLYGLLYFLIGMCLARIMGAHHVSIGTHCNTALTARRVSYRLPPLTLCVAIAIAAFVVGGVYGHTARPSLVSALVLPFVVLLIASAARSDLRGVHTIWGSQALLQLGKWSYALYLIHVVFLHVIERYVAPMRLGPAPALIATAALLAVTTGIAAAAYYIVERPAETWLRGARRREPEAVLADPM